MDLISLFEIVKRRWLYMVVPAAIVLIIAIVTAEEAVVPAPSYNVGVRFLVAPPQLEDEVLNDVVNDQEERYYQWLTSEYVVNGVADWVNSIGFAELVAAELDQNGITLDPLLIFNSSSADAIRSRLTLSMNYGDEATLAAMMDAAIVVIETQNELGIPHLTGGDPAEVTLLDRPVINAVAPPIGNQLDLPLRIGLALIVGIVIGLLADYFDPVIRSKDDLKRAQLPLLAEGPVSDARQLRGALLLQSPEPEVIVLSGLDRKTDVSNLAVDLAQSMASGGRSVLLIDADLVQPTLQPLVNASDKLGFAERLSGQADPSGPVAIAQGELKLIPTGNPNGKGDDLISSPHLGRLIQQFRSAADTVIVKARPLSESMDAALIASHADLGLFCVKAGSSRRANLQSLLVTPQTKGVLIN